MDQLLELFETDTVFEPALALEQYNMGAAEIENVPTVRHGRIRDYQVHR